MKSKQCSRCKEVKSLEKFVRYKKSRDGRSCYCYECSRIQWRKNYKRKGIRKKTVKHLESLTPNDCAYAAGFFDGEGCIVVAEEKPRKQTWSSSYRVQISIANKNKAIIEWFKNNFGGRIATTKRGVFYWVASSLEAASILEKIEPFLKVKKYRAQLITKFTNIGRGGQKDKIGKENIEKKKNIAKLISKNNQYSGNMEITL